MRDSDPTLSVVMPVFNARATMREALASLAAQDFSDFEVLLFDDGSADGSVDIARDFARKDARIQVTTSGHVGIVEALRLACAKARGRYIARMDADDIAEPSRLGKQFRLMEDDSRLALCGTGVAQFGDALGSGRKRYETWINGLVTPEEMAREVFVECPIAHPTLMIRRDVYEKVGGYQDRGWAEDYDLVLRAHCAGHRMGKVAEPLLRWRHSEGRLSIRDDRYSLERFRDLKRHYLSRTYLKDRPRFYQWGAGEVGKAWLKEWNGHRPEAVIDINPRKIGKEIHDTPVTSPEELPRPGEGFTLVAVGARGAREEIRSWFKNRDYEELEDFVFVA